MQWRHWQSCIGSWVGLAPLSTNCHPVDNWKAVVINNLLSLCPLSKQQQCICQICKQAWCNFLPSVHSEGSTNISLKNTAAEPIWRARSFSSVSRHSCSAFCVNTQSKKWLSGCSEPRTQLFEWNLKGISYNEINSPWSRSECACLCAEALAEWVRIRERDVLQKQAFYEEITQFIKQKKNMRASKHGTQGN